MARNTVSIAAPPQRVFRVLVDPEAYPQWVVGARNIRAVEPAWPAPGAAFHHSMSGGVRDRTVVLDIEEPWRLSLQAYARPLGIAHVRLEVRPTRGGSLVICEEEPAPGTRARRFRRLLDPAVYLRNLIGLRRLKRLVEGKTSEE